MTSEVLVFNKKAMVLAADSAVTSSAGASGSRPRYSKTANKIFELSPNGNVAVAIFGGASLDAVPWEVAIKLFRRSLSGPPLGTVSEYVDRLVAFLRANDQLFPPALRAAFVQAQFESATVAVMNRAGQLNGSITDVATAAADRSAAWAAVHPQLVAEFGVAPVDVSLTSAALDEVLRALDTDWVPVLLGYQAQYPVLEGVDLRQLAELAHRLRYSSPTNFIGSTGIAVAGFGAAEIFPQYRLLHVHGHVGDEVVVSNDKAGGISHAEGSLILPLAQKSMIDLFTDGFGFSLWSIIESEATSALDGLVADLRAAGVDLSVADVAALSAARHRSFMQGWTRKNWKENYDPLMDVLTTLSVEEMAHLAETLLTLQSLKERVTSASEEVGGPIDVAAITKGEGLVWLKRKHFFPADLNARYLHRLAGQVNA